MLDSLQAIKTCGREIGLADIAPDLMTLSIKIEGEGFDCSFTGDVAKALGDLQVSLYRAAAEILHGTRSAASLTAEEKDLFRVQIKVISGCTELKIDGRKLIEAIVKSVVEKMSGHEITMVFMTVIAAFTAVSIYDKHAEIEEKGLANDAMLKQAQALVVPITHAIDVSAEAIAKASRGSDSVRVGEKRFTKEEIIALNSRSARQSPETDTVSLICRVLGVHKEDGITKVDLIDLETSERFTAKMPPSGLFEDDDLPGKTSQIAELIDSSLPVTATLFVKESKSRTERLIVSWTAGDATKMR